MCFLSLCCCCFSETSVVQLIAPAPLREKNHLDFLVEAVLMLYELEIKGTFNSDLLRYVCVYAVEFNM